MQTLFHNLFQYRQMIFSLVHRDLRGRYKGSVLGFLWTFLNPLLQLFVYTFVFSTIMHSNIEKYYLFLFVALIPWNFFSSSLSFKLAKLHTSSNMSIDLSGSNLSYTYFSDRLVISSIISFDTITL